MIDELAQKLKIDPIELRLKNAVKQGSRRRMAQPSQIGFIETLKRPGDEHSRRR